MEFMLDKSDFQEIAKLVRYEIDDAIANFAKIVMETMASKEDLKDLANTLATKKDLEDLKIDLKNTKIELKRDIYDIKADIVNHREFDDLTKRTIKLEKIHLKELAYA